MQVLLREYGALQQKSAAVGLFQINFRWDVLRDIARPRVALGWCKTLVLFQFEIVFVVKSLWYIAFCMYYCLFTLISWDLIDLTKDLGSLVNFSHINIVHQKIFIIQPT